MYKHKKILLVDDDEDDQLLFSDAISEIGGPFKCAIANNGKEALDYLKKNPPPPDIIFLDLNMPVMNGVECLRALKREDSYKEIPIVIFTTSSNPIDTAQTQKLGAKVFFTKPADFGKLCTKLNQLLNSDIPLNEFSY